MSADNGIYIATFPTGKGDKVEYRVIHAQAIENVGNPDDLWHERCVREYFANAMVFSNKHDAIVAAYALARDIAEEGPLEYGVVLCVFAKPYSQYTGTYKWKWEKD